MDKNFLIFGGSGDIGISLTSSLLELDHTHVWSSYKKNDSIIKGHSFYFDASEGISSTLLTELKNTHIDGLVYLIGEKSSKQLIRDTSFEEWKMLIDINALSFLKIYNQLYTTLKESSTKIVVMSSSAAYENKRLNGAYSGSKALLESICMTIANEEKENGIQINVIAPSLVDSKLARETVKLKGYNNFDQYVNTYLNGNILQIKDVVKTILELLFDKELSRQNGQIIRLGNY